MFPQKSTKYIGYVFTGSALSAMWMGVSSALIVNPDNLPKTEISILSPTEKEEYFSFDISSRIRYFFYLYAFINVLIPCICSFFIKEKDEDFLNINSSNDDSSKTKVSLYKQVQKLSLFARTSVLGHNLLMTNREGEIINIK